MDPIVETYSPNQQVLADDLNSIQANAIGLRIASQNNDDSATVVGAQVFDWQRSGTVAIGGLVAVDDIVDWRDCKVIVHWRVNATTQNTRPGAANDYLYGDLATTTEGTRIGYLGLGGFAAGAVNPPSAGNPPVPAAAASYALELFTDFWVYAHPTLGDLYVYNDTASNQYDLSLTITRIGPLDKR